MNATTLLLFIGAISQQIPDTDRQSAPIRLFVPDGQLQSHPLRVFVTADVGWENTPTLKLVGIKLLPWEQASSVAFGLRDLAQNQEWTGTIDGQEISQRGTLLLFDVRGLQIPLYKAMLGVTPTLTWTVESTTGADSMTAIAERPVNIGNTIGAAIWTVLIVVLLIYAIASLGRRAKSKGAIYYFAGPDGRMSLSRVQVGAWTVAVGTVILAFGLIRLAVPEIPESLIALMGLSFATGGISYALVGRAKQTQAKVTPSWPDLVRGSSKNGDPVISIARAQMLFWTVLTLILFLSKSLLDGQMWPVPWQLVALMGISQAGYLSTKIKLQVPTPTDQDVGGQSSEGKEG